MLSHVEMQAIRNAINEVNSGKKSKRFIVDGRGFFIGHYSVPKSTWILYNYIGKELFTYSTEIISIDTAVHIFAEYIEDHTKRLDGHFYTVHYHHAPVTDYPATTHYISLEERVKRLEKRTDDNERSRDYLMKELAQRKDLEEKMEKTFDKIYDIVEEWEEDWPEDSDKYWIQSIKDALDEIEED